MDGSLQRIERIMEHGFATLADLLRETNSRLDETNSRLDETNSRLDETNSRLDEANSRLDETNSRLGRLEGRFDHFLDTVGGAVRPLRADVDDLRVRVETLERKVG